MMWEKWLYKKILRAMRKPKEEKEKLKNKRKKKKSFK